MGVVTLNELRPGMVLEEPLHDAKGVMLLPRGTQLAAKHLALVRRWGVRRAVVEEAGGEVPAAERAARLDRNLLAAIDRALDEKFALDRGDELMREIKRVVRKMAVQDALRSKGGSK